jgi:hypothetical protein
VKRAAAVALASSVLWACSALTVPDAGDPDDSGAGADADGGVGCTHSSAQQCSCYAHAPQPNQVTCQPADVGGQALCCATTPSPEQGGWACFCESWGCSSGVCGLAAGTAATATAPDGGVCCAWATSPGCSCSAASSCAADRVQVARCEVATAQCGAQYPYPVTVASCR